MSWLFASYVFHVHCAEHLNLNRHKGFCGTVRRKVPAIKEPVKTSGGVIDMSTARISTTPLRRWCYSISIQQIIMRLERLNHHIDSAAIVVRNSGILILHCDDELCVLREWYAFLVALFQGGFSLSASRGWK